ncbi:YdcF family protein [Romboutsia lituseburensis]|uniref:YdcF family protein n=1 Tax=Romboutsia lituseburensis TaxID=1537 RepID=UPI00215A971E|nr:YdcF family protein [Romboutsia lituseburensis]MCR8746918.1 YdcF family protein [Romboutsia lituseburensis]
MIKKNKLKIAFLVISVIFIFIGYLAFSIWSFGNKSQLVKTDAAIVLGAAVWDNKPSPVLRERINHAIWLYDNNYLDKIIFTGGKGEGNKYSESEVSRDYAIKNDVSLDDILIETKSKITEENIKYAYEVANEKNLKTFTIVSDPLHMKRAILMAKNTGIKAYSSPTPSSVYKTLNSQVPFLLRELFFYTGYILSLPFR